MVLNALADVIATTDKPIYSKFTADVKASGNTRPIEEYTGTIDGNNHKLTLKGHTLIEKAKGEVIIKNLIIDGSVNGSNNTAAFIGNTDVDANNNIIIENCGNAAVIKASGNNAAGFVGWIGENDKLCIKNSYNYGSVTSNENGANPFVNSNELSEIIYENCYYLKDSAKANGTPVNPQISISKRNKNLQTAMLHIILVMLLDKSLQIQKTNILYPEQQIMEYIEKEMFIQTN